MRKIYIMLWMFSAFPIQPKIPKISKQGQKVLNFPEQDSGKLKLIEILW